MKTLIIASHYPLPEIGGNKIRTMNFVRFFRQFGEVDLAYYQPREDGAPADGTFSRTFHVGCIETGGNSLLREAYEKIRYSKPWIVGSQTSENKRRMLSLIENGMYDRIICRYAVNAYPLFFLPNEYRQKVIIDIDDVMTDDLYEVLYGTLPGINRLKSLLDMKLYQRYQLKCASLGQSLVCSEHDRKLLTKKMATKNIFVVPNIVPHITLPDSYQQDGFANLKTILFVGNLSYKPNLQGLYWFIEEIFNRLLQEGDKVHLLVVGKDPDIQLRQLCNGHSQIELVESPPDVVPFYEKSGVVVVPLLNGGGTRIKILEAGRVRRPVISTPTGAYGLMTSDFNDILLMKDHASFRERYQWLSNRTNYNFVVENMNSYVETNLSRQNFNQAMCKVLSGTGGPNA